VHDLLRAHDLARLGAWAQDGLAGRLLKDQRAPYFDQQPAPTQFALHPF
jgi:hypothetical protein